MGNINKVLIFLNGKRGLVVCKELIKKKISLEALVVSSDKLKDTLFLEECKAFNTRLIITDNVNTDQVILNLRPNLIIIAGYPTIFKKNLLSIPKLGVINLHCGKLPEYRGGSPLQWQIINNEKKAWCSIIKTYEGIDNGIILSESFVNIGKNEQILEIQNKTNTLFAKLTYSVVTDLFNGKKIGKKQSLKKASYWHQRNEKDGLINWTIMNARQVHNLVRAITKPYPGAYCFIMKNKVTIWQTELCNNIIRGTPGRVLYLQGKGPYVICADKAILLKKYSIKGVYSKLSHGAHFNIGEVL